MPAPPSSPPAALADEGSGSWRDRLVVAACAAIFCVGFGTMQVHSYRAGVDPESLADVLVFVPPLFDWSAADPSGSDAIVDYNRGILPLGFKALFAAAAPWVDPATFGTLLPYLLYPLLLLGIFAAAFRLAGLWAAIGAVLLPLSASSVLIHSCAIGIPRSFAPPILALAAAALVRGSVRWLVALTVAGALLYPVAGLLVGAALTAQLIGLSGASRGGARDWSLRRRLLVVATTAAISALCMAPQAATIEAWGPTIRMTDKEEFPELESDGRFSRQNRPPFQTVGSRAAVGAWDLLSRNEFFAGERANESGARRTVPIVFLALPLLLIAGAAIAARRSMPMRRLLVLPAVSVAGYFVTAPIAPYLYLPSRYLTFAVPIVLAILLAVVPTVVAARARLAGSRALGLLAVAGWIGLAGWAPPPQSWQLPTATGIDDFAAGTNPQARFAGFPAGPVQEIPYRARRLILTSYEVHNVFHRRYALELRQRTLTLIAALFGSDESALVELRDRYQVRYLIVDTGHLEQPPSYFHPFGREIKSVWLLGKAEGFAVARVRASTQVFSSGSFWILDLTRLSPGTTQNSR